MSVIKKVRGYGKIPAETTKVLKPKSMEINLLDSRLHTTKAAVNIAANTK
jgi:hypothetical protein